MEITLSQQCNVGEKPAVILNSELSCSSVSSDPWRLSFALESSGRAGLYHNVSLTTYAFNIFILMVVVSQIHRIACQPEIIAFLRGGQSRSWSAEQGEIEQKEEVWQHHFPPALIFRRK